MRLDGERESDNVEDRRDDGGGGGGGGIGFGHIGIGTVVLAVLGGLVFHVNPLTILGLLGGGGAPVPHSAPAQPRPHTAQDDQMKVFVSKVLADTEDVWTQIFQQRGGQYRDPKLVLFRGATRTACGQGESAMGPFYCPADEKVYIDLGFYQTLKDKLGAPGDFAQAYVIAHEVGHHVQNLMGISGKVDAMRGRVNEAQQNALSVRLELQADCFAGIWARSTNQRQILEAGDVQEALGAAAAVGDDHIEKQTTGTVTPESWTHGSAAERAGWFQKGFDNGTLQACDTFGAKTL